jgi:hypothetical protein
MPGALSIALHSLTVDGLVGIGHDPKDIDSLCIRLFEPDRTVDDDRIASPIELAMRLKSRKLPEPSKRRLRGKTSPDGFGRTRRLTAHSSFPFFISNLAGLTSTDGFGGLADFALVWAFLILAM